MASNRPPATCASETGRWLQMEVLHVEGLDPAARSSKASRSVLLGTGQYPKAILSGHCTRVSFDPVERTEGDDADRQKAEIKG
jgi:hypothetical protein